jgi:hypothetical protein
MFASGQTTNGFQVSLAAGADGSGIEIRSSTTHIGIPKKKPYGEHDPSLKERLPRNRRHDPRKWRTKCFSIAI